MNENKSKVSCELLQCIVDKFAIKKECYGVDLPYNRFDKALFGVNTISLKDVVALKKAGEEILISQRTDFRKHL